MKGGRGGQKSRNFCRRLMYMPPKAPVKAGLPRTNESLILVYTYRAKPCQTPLLKVSDFMLPLFDLLPAGPQVHFRLGSCYCGAVPWRCTGAGLARASASAHHVELRMEVLGNACVAPESAQLGWTGWFGEQLFRAKSDSFKMGVGD